jgi:4-oxalomesaconate hydratase
LPTPTILFIGAHDVDFMVRAGGTLTRYARAGSTIVAISLSMGERQESERLWKTTAGITVDQVIETSLREARRCAELIGCDLRYLGWEDCPLRFDRDRLLELAGQIQELRPNVVITHWPEEVTNWDHLDTASAVRRAIQYANAAGTSAATGHPAWAVPALYFAEPWFPFPDRNAYHPNVWVDITDVYDAKLEGMRAAWSHGLLDVTYPLCAEFRGQQARLLSGNQRIKYAEAFVTETPWVGDRLPLEGLDAEQRVHWTASREEEA